MSNTLFHGDVAISSFRSTGTVFAFTDTTKVKSESTVTTVQVETQDKVSGLIAAWGKNNDYPQKIMAGVRKNGSASSGLRFMRKAHYGNGLVLLRKKTAEGKKTVELIDEADEPAIDDFFELNQMKRFWKETIADLEWFNIAFPEYILSADYSTINRVKRQKTAWCRFEAMDEKTGLINNVYISQKFGVEGVTPESKYCSTIPLIDSYWSADQVKEYCKKNKIHNFIRPIFYPLIDEAYYPRAEWHAITESGWLEVANAVPEFKMNLFKNQVSIKFHIKVDERYFKELYGEEWIKYTIDQRKEERKKLVDAINEHLSNVENAGKTIQTMMFKDELGNQVSYVEIEAIDDKFKEGSYLPEAEAANSEILFALGLDPSLAGAGIPGGKLGAGSGSDKTAAFNILSALFKTNRETTLEIFEFIRNYNGWDRTIKADFENTILTTLDKNPTGTQKMI